MPTNKGNTGLRYWLAMGCAAMVTILFLTVHVITVILAYQYSGIFAAIVSFVIPLFSELFWGFKLWMYSGNFFNLYNVAVLTIIGFIFLLKKLRPDLLR